MKADGSARSSASASASKGGADHGRSLLVVQPETCDRLRRLVHNLCQDPNLHEDALQEALLCHWRAEVSHPGQTAEWYLRRCRFWIFDYLGKGRSVDSPKHRGSTSLEEDSGPLALAAPEDILLGICERDLFEQLMRRLGPPGQQVLPLLRQGLGVRETARQLGLSHVAILAQRRHIAEQCRALLP
jgi:DNA-directed RNA polymerase specialized sigma24 family protein